MTRFFVSELKRIRKGKEVICGKTNMQKRAFRRPVASKRIAYLPLAFLL